jgi:UDP-N-acetylglucosamine 2-epimerase (non-hydrolysing)
MVIVVGDVNSTVAGAVTAKKLEIPVAHVEAGLRSFDRSMPEEINRILTDGISDWLFTSEPAAEENLLREGVDPQRIHMVGNVMIDTLFRHLPRAREQAAHRQWQLNAGQYVVLTLHRPSNVDDPKRLAAILRAVHEVSSQWPVLFPLHPRTRARLDAFNMRDDAALNGYQAVEPQGYLTMLGLMASARFVMTDSGGIQEETTALKIPCLTLRENTERPVTIDQGTNQLVGWETERILAGVEAIASGQAESRRPELWDGKASARIAQVLAESI